MLISKWRVRSNRFLGTIHVPIIDLELQDTRGRYVPFSLCVDSGAVVSLLPQSAGQILGLEASAGKPIELGGVGFRAMKAQLHNVPMRLADLPVISVPIAISALENVPGLLGRAGVFDQLDISFDSRRRETRIVLP